MPDCAYCGTPFVKNSNRQKYCSRRCCRKANPQYEVTGEKGGPPAMFSLATARRVRRRVQIEGVSIGDIAEALGCSTRTVYEMVPGKRATYQEARI